MYATIKLFREDGTLLHECTFNALDLFQQSFPESIIEGGYKFFGYEFTPGVKRIEGPLEVEAHEP